MPSPSPSPPSHKLRRKEIAQFIVGRPHPHSLLHQQTKTFLLCPPGVVMTYINKLLNKDDKAIVERRNPSICLFAFEGQHLSANELVSNIAIFQI